MERSYVSKTTLNVSINCSLKLNVGNKNAYSYDSCTCEGQFGMMRR